MPSAKPVTATATVFSTFESGSALHATTHRAHEDLDATNSSADLQDSPRYSQRYKPGCVGIYFLGIALTLWGQFFGWSIGLSAGLYSFLIVYIIMGLAYIAFCLCMAEITSALPFAGGAFGLARCTLGFFPAFLIGCCESCEYIVTVAIVAVATTDLATISFPAIQDSKPLVWMLYFIPATALHCIGGAPFWLVTIGGGACVLVLLLIYCFGVLADVNFQANALADPSMHFVGGLDHVRVIFPSLAWFFIGIEALNLASNDVERPKTEIPRAQVACVCTLFFTGLFTLLVTVSLPNQGGLAGIATISTPLNSGFQRIFHIATNTATGLVIPLAICGAYSISWASAKLIHSMGSSGLLPSWLAKTSARYGTPYVAITISAIASYTICLIVHSFPAITGYLLPTCLLFAFCSYAGQCIGYISLKAHFPIAQHRHFRNPFGIFGAIYALLVWSTGIVAILGFQGHHGVEAVFFLVLLVVLGIYYMLFAQDRQVMSAEERDVLLVAHVAHFNKLKPKRYNVRGPGSYIASRVSSSPGRVLSGLE